MVIGGPGAVGLLALPLAEVEPRPTPDFATTQHLPMEVQHVLDQLQRVLPVVQLLVEQVFTNYDFQLITFLNRFAM
jgi:hypothetical protein